MTHLFYQILAAAVLASVVAGGVWTLCRSLRRDRSGAADLLVVALVAALGIGWSCWRTHQRKRLHVDDRYRATVEQTMRDVSAAVGLDWRNENIRVTALPGERNINGFWCRWVEGKWKAGFAYATGQIAVVVDPATRDMPGGLRSPLGHELAHVLLDQHCVPSAEHHARMRRAGIITA